MATVLTREQTRLVDRLAVERYGIPGLILMENAGRSAAEIIDGKYGPAGSAAIYCGTGNNGGDGCVIARHLHNAGWSVRLIVVGDVGRMTADTTTNYEIVRAMELEDLVAVDDASRQAFAQSISHDDIVIDALLGTGFSGEVRGPLAKLINELNSVTKRAMVSIDVPSGLDCDSGSADVATIRADLTITFVASKPGYASSIAAAYLGELQVAQIGAPCELIREVTKIQD